MKSIYDISHFSNVLSRRKAIRARCIDCTGFVKAEVRECNFRLCTLHPYRSGYGKQNPVLRDKAIRKYCLWCMNDQLNEVKLCPSTDCPLYPYRLTRNALQRFENKHIGGRSDKKKSPAMDSIPEVQS